MEDFDINSFKSAVINTIVENNEIIFNLDKEYIDAGGGLLYKKIFPYLQKPTIFFGRDKSGHIYCLP